jgi:hypothetical protein
VFLAGLPGELADGFGQFFPRQHASFFQKKKTMHE